MKTPEFNHRAQQLQMLRKCPIPPKVLAGFLQIFPVMNDVQLET